MHIFNVESIISSVGLLGIFGIIFAESGLFFAFFLPGDSLLFTAGFLASQGLLPISSLLFGVMFCALAAGYVGYWFGNKVGHAIFQKEDSLFFKKKYLIQTRDFYEKYGHEVVILARFVPIVRTFSPIFAGIGQMNFKKFSIYNLIGAVIWPLLIILAGFYLGRIFPGVDKYLFPVTILIIIVSILPGVYESWKHYLKSGKV